MVTFDSFTDQTTLDRPGFGEGFFLNRRVPAVHVISRDNRWYQEADLPAALDAARVVTARYPRVVSYGSSMGGFAAVRFGAAAGASTAIAISPQFSIDPREAAFETRWAYHSRRIRFVHDADRFPAVRRAYVFYDPRDPDALHADLIAARCPTERVRLPYGGHPVASFLNETGLLSEAVQTICAGSFDALACERTARARRRGSGQYLFTLAHRLALHHLETKLRLARMAVAASPADPVYRSYLGLVLERSGRWSEAEDAYRSTVEPEADRSESFEMYARALLRRGRLAEASELMARALQLSPEASRIARTHALVLLAEGRRTQGLRRLFGAIAQEPRHIHRALREFWAVSWWRLFGPKPGEQPGTVIHLPYGPELASRPPPRPLG